MRMERHISCLGEVRRGYDEMEQGGSWGDGGGESGLEIVGW